MAKKETKNKVKKTPKQKAKIALNVILCILLVIAILAGIFAITNMVSVKANKNFITQINKVEYENQLVPELDENTGYYTFTTDRDFKAMQLTDVHIGAGFMSTKKDSMAINAVAAMISEEKPDLVLVSGDIAYPVPFQAGTFNNKNGAVEFAQLMEELGVYWCPAFGNHDTEAYSFFSRTSIGKLYSDKEKYPHCLFQAGPEEVDGCGNYFVNVKNTSGEITQSFIMVDSHSYIDNDYFGILWKYDCVHENQVQWYEGEVKKLTDLNNGKVPKSLMFFHIPPREMREAYEEYKNNGYKDTADVKYIYGKAGEKNAAIYPSEKNYGLFDKCLELGSTQGMFFGHDHLNNVSLDYKGIRLTYGFSIDYLAYSGISKYGAQRGCTIITVKPDGSFESKLENYYQEKYASAKDKETVTMDDFYTEDEEKTE